MEGIYQSLYEDALISKSGGGVGFNTSKVRPKGDKLSKGGEASGPISFLRVFNESAKIIMTGGQRRSAHIAIMNIDHPDIEEFITVKKGSQNNELTQFNISVGITDAFMEKVLADGDWDLIWGGKVYKTVKAKYLYALLAKNAFEHNEPGVLFLDTVEKYNNGYWAFKLDRTNPCQHSWAKVLTPEGIKTFQDIEIGASIWSKEGWTTVVNKWKTGVKKVYRYETPQGVFYGTENHRVVSGNEKVEVGIATTIETLRGEYTPQKYSISPQDVMDGLVIGDGSVHKASNNLVILYIGNNDQDYLTSEVSPLIKKYRPGIKEKVYEILTTLTPQELPKTYERRIPSRFLGSPSRIVGILRGLYSANGSVLHNRITLKSASKGLVEDVQLMLSSIGIRSYTTINKSTKTIFYNGEYTCKESYDINITVDREKFVKSIGFIQAYKNKKITITKTRDKYQDSGIRNVSYISEEDVWDITVDSSSHTYWTQGLNVSNCGEIIQPSYSLCCLASLNLTKFVREPFTPNASIDFDLFKKSVKIGIRFLDNVLDVTDYPLDRIREFSKQWRRVGLGFTGLGDLFAMLGVVYGSPESVEISNKIGESLRDNSYMTSVELAYEKGKFSAYDEKINKSEFIKSLPSDIRAMIKDHGLRNIGLNTCAPTGTISLSLGNNCSSGIEPIFSLQYDRSIRTGRDDEVKKETVYDYAWLQYKKLFGEDSKVPPSFITTLDIDPYKGIDIQAAFQKYIDHSISKTCNLPGGYSFEDYIGLWTYAYKAGLKGFTSFNPGGSVKGILEHTDKNKKEIFPTIERHNAPKRPEELPCDIHEITVDKNKFVVAIGTYFGSLYEVFLVDNNDGKIDVEKHREGTIKKVGKGKYDLLVRNGEEKVLIDNISKFSGGMYGSLSRMVSMALRHGVPLEFIVDTLQKSEGFNRFDKVVARVLKKYIKDGEPTLSHKTCGNCGSNDMVYEGGCVVCKSCGSSQCS
jgi:ribonucleoside-diphosphate reductase alpha chain